MRARPPLQNVATALGVFFVVVGILGFVPGATAHYGDLKLAGHGSDAKLLWIFETSVLQNVVHLLFGIAGVLLARTVEGARTFLVGGGLIYLVLFLFGAIWHGESGTNWIPVNWADNVLHLVLGVTMLVLGVVLAGGLVQEDRRAPAV
jgi:hypothetical protein